MRTYKCDVCGAMVEGENLGELTAELQGPGLKDGCRACVKTIGDTMKEVEKIARQDLVDPFLRQADEAEQKLHQEIVIPAGKKMIETIRGMNKEE